MREMSIFVLTLKIENLYNLCLDVVQVLPGSEAGISFTLTSIALFELRQMRMSDLTSHKVLVNWDWISTAFNFKYLKLELPLRLPKASFYSEREEVSSSMYEGIESSFKGISSLHQGVSSIKEGMHEPASRRIHSQNSRLESSRINLEFTF